MAPTQGSKEGSQCPAKDLPPSSDRHPGASLHALRGGRVQSAFLPYDNQLRPALEPHADRAADRLGDGSPVLDKLIHLATRNARHLERCQAKVFNPWKD